MGKDEVRRAREDANALASQLTDAVAMAGRLSETAESGGFRYLSATAFTLQHILRAAAEMAEVAAAAVEDGLLDSDKGGPYA